MSLLSSIFFSGVVDSEQAVMFLLLALGRSINICTGVYYLTLQQSREKHQEYENFSKAIPQPWRRGVGEGHSIFWELLCHGLDAQTGFRLS